MIPMLATSLATRIAAFFSKAAVIVVLTVIALLAGIYTGWTINSKLTQASHDKALSVALQAQRSELLKDLKKAEAINADLRTKSEAITALSADLKTQVTQSLKAQRKTNEELGHCLDLNARTASLLNSARANVRPSDTSGPGDAKEQTLAPISAEEFLENDLEIVRLYHELAANHDALVDWLEQEMKKRNP